MFESLLPIFSILSAAGESSGISLHPSRRELSKIPYSTGSHPDHNLRTSGWSGKRYRSKAKPALLEQVIPGTGAMMTSGSGQEQASSGLRIRLIRWCLSLMFSDFRRRHLREGGGQA